MKGQIVEVDLKYYDVKLCIEEYVTKPFIRSFTVCLQVKGLSPDELAVRNDLVLALPDRIQAIPDGAPAAPKQTGGGGWAASGSRAEIKFDSGDISLTVYFSLLKNGVETELILLEPKECKIYND